MMTTSSACIRICRVVSSWNNERMYISKTNWTEYRTLREFEIYASRVIGTTEEGRTNSNYVRSVNRLRTILVKPRGIPNSVNLLYKMEIEKSKVLLIFQKRKSEIKYFFNKKYL